MKRSSPRILTINGGSSSIKFALYAAESPLRRILEGAIERIGTAEAEFHVRGAGAGENFSAPVKDPSPEGAAQALIEWVDQLKGDDTVAALGHRIVHGGPKYSAPAKITSEMLDELRRLSPFDPEHLPGEIALAEAFRRRFPDLPQVACFDTAFHHDLPGVARLLPIPRRYEAQGLRRYGFHGLSYEYLLEEFTRVSGAEAARGRIILAHLGNGASLAAVRDGRPVDTTMAFTPAAGLVMSTRSGDLDPGLFRYLADVEQMTPAQFQKMVNHESGMRGISETSGDVRDLLAREKDDARAAEALAIFCYQVKKWIGSFAAALGGLDALVFSGGIGEHAPAIRERICAGLDFLGIELDPKKNSENAPVISILSSRAMVRVIPTDEEIILARSVARVLGLDSPADDPETASR